MKNSASNPESDPSKSMEVIGLFARFWQPGAVKTRLAKHVGAESACAIYIDFLTHLVRKLANVADQRYVVFSPADKQPEFKKFCHAALSKDTWQLTPQVDSDLGARMRTFFEQQFETGLVEKVVVIGADSPQLTTDVIEQSFEQLDRHDVVIGPSTDGGYYLIGMRQKCFDVFSGIQWSEPSVYQATIDRLKTLHATHFDLPALTDVDEVHDLESLHAFLSDRQSESNFNSLDKDLLQRVGTHLKARINP